MTQSSHHVEPIRPGGGLRRLRQGNLGRLKETAPTVLTTSQFVSTLKAEIDRSSGEQRTLVVMRIRHRALPGTADRALKGGSLPAELSARFQAVDENIRVTVVSPTQLLAFIPALRRRADGEARVREVLQSLTTPIVIDGLPHHLAPTVGGALLDNENPTVEAIVEAALLAVDEAGPSNPMVMFLPYQRVRHQRNDDVRRALREAMLANQVSYSAQPAYDLATGKVVAFEVLARWQREGKGAVPPVEFVAMAEELGMAHFLSRQVLARSLGPVTEWVDGGLVDEVTAWINVTPTEILHPEFASVITTATQVHPQVRIGLEVAPSPAAADRVIQDHLKTLAGKGVRLAVADFGIGNANLGLLQQLPYDSIKLNRALTRQIAGNRESAELVRLLIELAGVLGLETTAQGIESAEQLEVVRSFGVPIGQGFLFAEPAEHPDQMAAVLDSTAPPSA
jgi:EAL domain-containing protein (putative c-di-GMP-specific phosphodiesterase class I)